jgi:hypothetical protein
MNEIEKSQILLKHTMLCLEEQLAGIEIDPCNLDIVSSATLGATGLRMARTRTLNLTDA